MLPSTRDPQLLNTPDQNDVSTALALLRDLLAEEEQRIRTEGAAAMQGGDYEPHKSDGKSIRWRNSAQWARNAMVNQDGRMKKSPTGIWEISDTGRKWLEGQE